jgi:hypothetical protein
MRFPGIAFLRQASDWISDQWDGGWCKLPVPRPIAQRWHDDRSLGAEISFHSGTGSWMEPMENGLENPKKMMGDQG